MVILQLEQSGESYSTSSTSLPNSEDINRDNTLESLKVISNIKIRLSPQTMNIK